MSEDHRFTNFDVADPDGMWAFLSDQVSEDRLLGFLRERFAKETLKSLQSSSMPVRFGSLVASDLNRIINSGPIFDPEIFSATKLSPATVKLLKVAPPNGDGTMALNKRLLEDVLRDFLHPNLQHALDSYWEQPDEKTFERLLTVLNPLILSFVLSLGCESMADAVDIRQEALFSIARKISTFKGRSDGELKSWVFTICRRRWADCFRKRPKGKFLDHESDAIDEEIYQAKCSGTVTAEVMVEYDFVQELLGSLSPQERTVFLLIEQNGFSTKEVAKILGISDHTARGRLARARRQVKAQTERLKLCR